MTMPRILVASLFLMLSGQSYAEWRCDCTQITGSCRASVDIVGNGISVSSDTQQCSRVDYFVDGQPFVTVTVDGEAKESWLSGTREPRVLVQSCQVCADGATSSDVVERPSASDTGDTIIDATYLPVVTFDPQYPDSARTSGIEGYVIVKAIVNDAGRVEGVRVLESKPDRVFDNAALAAVRRWRYPPRDSGADDVETQERVTFSLRGNRSALRSTGQPVNIASTQTQGSLNNCVREADVLRQRDRQEVQLRNVCNEAVLVYSCTEGTGVQAGRWSCSDANTEGTILIKEGDSRAGRSLSQYTNRGTTKFLYSERQALYTPPSGRYWWIACSFGDSSCRDAATRWRDSLHDRSTQLRPDNEQVRVARSR